MEKGIVPQFNGRDIFVCVVGKVEHAIIAHEGKHERSECAARMACNNEHPERSEGLPLNFARGSLFSNQIIDLEKIGNKKEHPDNSFRTPRTSLVTKRGQL